MGKDLDKLGEFGVIDIFRREAEARHSGAGQGIGDDCAVLPREGAESILVTTDMLVEGVHFLRSGITPWQLGWKSLAVNISDIAAMGGEPTAAFLAIGLAPDLDAEFIGGFKDGLFACAEEYAVELMGGDTVASRRDVITCLTVLGKARADRVVLRSTGHAGERIFLGGCVGGSAAGLHILMEQVDSTPTPDREELLRAHLEPRPQVALGRFLGTNSLATAMLDVSDGVLADLGHICTSSGVGAVVTAAALPLPAAVVRLGANQGIDPRDWGLWGGEDYCLLFCGKPEIEEICHRELGITVHPIGWLCPEPGILVDRDGKKTPAPARGFDHFRR